MFLSPPKIMRWPYNLTQTHRTSRKVLITGGCSFTASTDQLESACSWPGFVRDRCKFDYAVDMSYPGVGNQYIHDSVKYALENLVDDPSECFVIVMWSGIDRLELIVDDRKDPPMLGNKCYRLCKPNYDKHASTQMCYDLMFGLADYLKSKDVEFFYLQYANMLWPPYLPKSDTTHNFDDYLNSTQLKELKKLPWVVNTSEQCLYDWAWFNDYLNQGDGFHPPIEANYQWVHEVLLPNAVKHGYFVPVDR